MGDCVWCFPCKREEFAVLRGIGSDYDGSVQSRDLDEGLVSAFVEGDWGSKPSGQFVAIESEGGTLSVLVLEEDVVGELIRVLWALGSPALVAGTGVVFCQAVLQSAEVDYGITNHFEIPSVVVLLLL